MGNTTILFMMIINPIIDLHKINLLWGESIMIIFDRLWETMKEKNISSYALREKYGIDSRTIRRLKANENVTTDTLNSLCIILKCKLDEIAEFITD